MNRKADANAKKPIPNSSIPVDLQEVHADFSTNTPKTIHEVVNKLRMKANQASVIWRFLFLYERRVTINSTIKIKHRIQLSL